MQKSTFKYKILIKFPELTLKLVIFSLVTYIQKHYYYYFRKNMSN